MILKTPCLYSEVPPVWAGFPTPFASGTTYLERAIQYVAAGDACVIHSPLPVTFKLTHPAVPTTRISTSGSLMWVGS